MVAYQVANEAKMLAGCDMKPEFERFLTHGLELTETAVKPSDAPVDMYRYAVCHKCRVSRRVTMEGRLCKHGARRVGKRWCTGSGAMAKL